MTAVQAKVRVPGKQRLIVKRRNVVGTGLQNRVAVAVGRDNGVDLDDAAPPGDRVIAAVDFIQRRPVGIGHLAQIVNPHGLFEVDPLKRHAGHVGAENLLAQGVHGNLQHSRHG